ncbi:MAG: SpoIID/LytB domain-containing protein [Rhodothermales bacterium]
MMRSTHSTIAFMLMLALAVGPASAQERDVRIRLLDLNEPVTIALSAHDGSVRLHAGDHEEPLMQLLPEHKALVSRASNQLHVEVDGLALFAASLRVEPEDGAHFGVEIRDDATGGRLRRYAGRLFVTADGSDWEIQLINEVPLEEYVASVVASEYGFDDLAGAKAMAVLVRTYTLGALGKYGPEYDHVDHTLSQVYGGLDRVTPVSLEATRQTGGQVLTYDDELVRAVYFSTSGGHTADNETVWDGPPLPYLRGKPDPYGDTSPHAAWSTRISRPRLLAELRSAYGQDINGFVIGERSPDGRVTSIALLHADGSRQTINGNEFRLLATRLFGARSIRSTLFDARRDGNEYVFEGRGFGHGVGLSQWGAHDMAQRGNSYTDILNFYFAGVELSRLDDASGAGVHVAEASARRVGEMATRTDGASEQSGRASEADAAADVPVRQASDRASNSASAAEAPNASSESHRTSESPSTSESGPDRGVEDDARSEPDGAQVRPRRIGW